MEGKRTQIAKGAPDAGASTAKVGMPLLYRVIEIVRLAVKWTAKIDYTQS